MVAHTNEMLFSRDYQVTSQPMQRLKHLTMRFHPFSTNRHLGICFVLIYFAVDSKDEVPYCAFSYFFYNLTYRAHGLPMHGLQPSPLMKNRKSSSSLSFTTAKDQALRCPLPEKQLKPISG
jgi:hypothetical protein